MSKVAQYLNEHLVGDATSASAVRQHYTTDGSVLSVTPELVVFPRVTNDIRKVARFAWQLAEKGHPLSITARGSGSDTTGGAIGNGIILDLQRHLSDILYVATRDKQKIVHVQPGVSIATLNATLKWHGLTIAGAPDEVAHATVGGAIAKASRGPASGKYTTVGDAVERLEVVLANGDLLETSRINRRELNKKKGLQTLEGEIYRQLDGLIEDNQELIQSLSSEHDSIGYRIEQVKQKDGSFDLTPLFIGSQGTLGIISEAVLRTDFYNADETILVATAQSPETARDIADQLAQFEPQILELIDSEYYKKALQNGKKYVFGSTDATEFSTVIYVSFDDFSDRGRERKLKKAIKLLEKNNVSYYTPDDHKLDDLRVVREVCRSNALSARADESLVPLCDGAYVPRERHEEFAAAVRELANKHHVSLPLHVNVLDGTIRTRPVLHLGRLSDKQKVFKLVTGYAELVHQTGGTVAGLYAEGRTNAFAAYPLLDEGERALYERIRQIFDPFHTLNAGVKQAADIKVLAKTLRSEYDTLL